MWEQLQNTQPQMFVFNVLLSWSAVGEKEIGVQMYCYCGPQSHSR